MDPTLQSWLSLPGNAALSAGDAAAAWSADVTTRRPIPLGPLTAYLRAAGLLRALRAAAADPAVPQDARDGLADFLDQVADARQSVLDTTDPAIAAKTAAVLAGLGALLPDGGASILALGGGPNHPPVTAADVAEARAAIAAAKAAADLRAAFAGVYNRGIDAIDAGERAGTLPTLDALRAG